MEQIFCELEQFGLKCKKDIKELNKGNKYMILGFTYSTAFINDLSLIKTNKKINEYIGRPKIIIKKKLIQKNKLYTYRFLHMPNIMVFN